MPNQNIANQRFMAHSSSGLGRVPLKDEITGSNPVCATKSSFNAFNEAKLALMTSSFCGFANILLITVEESNKFIFSNAVGTVTKISSKHPHEFSIIE